MSGEGTYLARILARTATDLAATKAARPFAEIRAAAESAPLPPPFEEALRRKGPAAIVAELKRKSPSKGFIDRDLDISRTAGDYAAGGAAALSVLTEGSHFSGSLDDLAKARAGCGLPLLRKDFIIDEYQLFEARAAGASAALLIVAALEVERLRDLLRTARELRVDALVEVHDAAELDQALNVGARVIGINNRDLRTFAVDLATTERLAPVAAQAGALVVAESGIESAEHVRRLANAGASAFLVGESLIRSTDRAEAVRRLAEALRA